MAERIRALLLLLLAGCADPSAIPGTQVRMDFTSAEPYAAPFPGEHMRREDGTIDASMFPNPKGVDFIRDLRRIASTELTGFGTTSGIFFALTDPIDEGGLPTMQETLQAGAPVFLVEIPSGRRIPIEVEFHQDGGPHGAPNLLSLVPLQGVPMAPSTLYAAVVRRGVLDGVSEGMRFLAAGRRPDGMSEAAYDRYRNALEYLESIRIDPDEVAGLTVFETEDPVAGMRAANEAAKALLPDVGAFELTEVYDDFCVFHSTIDMPVFQAGEPPYDNGGGAWAVEEGRPVLQRHETANFWLTLPRTPAPSAGYPTVVFIRTGGGGERPLIDRGPRETHGEPSAPGTGPAVHIARAGWAGMSIDGPHGGLRNITGGDEQLLIFNFVNPVAMRDNIRQSAVEIGLAADLIDQVAVSSTVCSGSLDPETVALFGHSMGATIAPLALAVQPRFRAVILSGAGGSWIENVVHKESPLPIKPLAQILLQYDEEHELHEHDPALSLLQWAGESADPPVFGAGIDAHVLMFQGIVDTYILPPIANATSLSLGLDAAEPVLEPSIEALLPLVGRGTVPLPAAENAHGRTRIVIQHPEDGIEDGHEVVFQTESPKHQYRCFLESLKEGTPEVPPAGAAADPCR